MKSLWIILGIIIAVIIVPASLIVSGVMESRLKRAVKPRCDDKEDRP